MPIGPVALRELLTSGRKRRYFALRLIFGTALLATIFTSFGRQFDGNLFEEQSIGVNQRNAFARETVETIVFAQTILVYIVTPAFVAGAIGVEVKSKTILYLLASPLTAREIVMGKLFARTARVAEFLVITLPILCLMPIYGTFEPKYLATLLGYAPSAAAMIAGVSMLVSTVIRSPREAIAAVYVLEFAVLVLPRFMLPYVGDMPSVVREWTILYVLQVDPLPPGLDDLSKYATFLYGYSLRLFACQWILGALCVGASCALLRPSALAEVSLGAIFRKRLFSRRKTVERPSRPRFRIVARRPCGDEPMLWKEIEVGASGRYLKLAAIVFAIMVAGACFAAFYEILYAYFEVVSNGRLTIENRELCDMNARRTLNTFLGTATIFLIGLWLLCVGGAAATGMSGEREADTWLSLTSTMIDAREILRAKLIGPIARGRAVLWAILMLWFAGAVMDSVNSLGIFFAIGVVVTATFSATAVGNFASASSTTSLRALSKTIILLLVLNGAMVLLFDQIGALPSGWKIGCAPIVAADALIDNADFLELLVPDGLKSYRKGLYVPGGWRQHLAVIGQDAALTRETFSLCIACVGFHFTTGMIFTFLSFFALEKSIDRPRKDRRG